MLVGSVPRVLLVQLVLLLPHLLGHLFTKYLVLLVPAPLVDLRLGQARLRRDLRKGHLRPARIRFELVEQYFQLVGGLPLAPENHALFLAGLLVDDKFSTIVCIVEVFRSLARPSGLAAAHLV